MGVDKISKETAPVAEETAAESVKMVPVAKELVEAMITTTVDLYIKISEKKFVRIMRSGETVAKDRVKQYSEQNIEAFYVTENDYLLWIDRILSVGGIVLTKEEVENSKKLLMLHKMVESVFNGIEQIGFSIPSIMQARQLMRSVITLVEAKESLSELFQTLMSCSEVLVSHSIAVSATSIMIAQEMGWTSQVTMEKLALGALLHDIGFKELPPVLFTKSRGSMNHEHVREYETHCHRGMLALQSLGILPDDVIAIVHEHHEVESGQGYPRHIKGAKIHPLAKVVALADCFVELTFINPHNTSTKSPKEALHAIRVTMGQPYRKDIFQALNRLIEKNEKVKKGS